MEARSMSRACLQRGARSQSLYRWRWSIDRDHRPYRWHSRFRADVVMPYSRLQPPGYVPCALPSTFYGFNIMVTTRFALPASALVCMLLVCCAGRLGAQQTDHGPRLMSGPDDIHWDDRIGTTTLDGAAITAMGYGSGNLYVSGPFNRMGDTPIRSFARWDGTRWSAVGEGIEGVASIIAVDGNDLYVEGRFARAGGVEVPGLAR